MGVSKFTAYRWFHEGTLPVPARRVGRLILVEVASATATGRTVAYARVCSHDQRGDLDRQVARLSSGVSAKRRRLARLLADPTATTIVIEHRDRLARFGVEYLEAALAAHGRRVLVMDDGDRDDDVVRDMTEVLTSFCARLYGRRGARNRANKALRCARADVGPMALRQDR